MEVSQDILGFLKVPEKSKLDTVVKNINLDVLRQVRKAGLLESRWDEISQNPDELDLFSLLINRSQGSDEDIDTYIDRVFSEVMKNGHRLINDTGNLTGTIPKDGNVLGHTKEQVRLFRKYGKIDMEAGEYEKFLPMDFLSSKEIYMIYKILCYIHDIFSESIVGDIVSFNKADDHEKLEWEVGKVLLRRLFRDTSEGNIMYEVCLEVFKINFSSDDEKNESHHPMYKHFRIYERLSYLNGMFLGGENKTDIYNYIYQTYSVLTSQLPAILIDTDVPSVRAFLSDHSKEIERCFVYAWSQRDNWEEAKQKLPPKSRGHYTDMNEEDFQKLRSEWRMFLTEIQE